MSEEVITVKNLSVSFDGQVILDDVNLSVRRSDFLGIIGPNGGGKTTLLKVILGLIQPDSGEVRLFGHPPREHMHRVGYVPQHSNLDLSFPASVFDVAMTGRMAMRPVMRRYTSADREVVRGALAEVEMDGLADRQIGKLSGGQRQRVFIARALAAEPEILLLDEPTASLDSQVGRSLYGLLERLSKDKTIVLVTHDIGVISKHVQKVACMNRQLFTHGDVGKIDTRTFERVYGCPVELIAHGVPHRVFELHDHDSGPEKGEGDDSRSPS